jgi:ATP-binding cassette, subfamily B, bacterial
MTTTQTPPTTPVPEGQAWRGVAADGRDDLTAETTAKLAGRSRRLLRDLLRPYRRVVKLLMIAVLVENAARLSIPLLVAKGIDQGIPPIQQHNNLRPLFVIVGIVLLATITQAISRNIFLVRSGQIGQDILFEIRQRIFRQFQRLSPAFHDSYTSGRVISRQTSDVDAIYEMLETGFDGLITAALTLVGTAVLLLYLDVKLGLVALLCGPFLAWATNWFRKESAKSYRVTREKVALVIVHFVESMNGIRAVQAFRREPRNQEIFDDVNDQYRAANLVAFRLVAWFMPEIRLIGNITIGVVLLYGGYLAYDGQVTVGVLAAFLLYLRQFFEPMMDISQFYNTFQSANAALEKISGVLEEEPGVPEPADPVALTDARGDLRFDHVRFEYVEGVPVLPDLDLAIPSGQTVALVGTTGAGKTTIAKLATRFYDPVDGAVTMDGIDLRSLGSTDLHRAVVMVLRLHRRQHPLRPARRDHGRRRGGHPRDRRPRLHRRPARGLPDPGVQPRRAAQRRPAPAGGLLAGLPGRPRGADPRRGDLVARRPFRAAGPAGPAHDPVRPHGHDHRPSALHRGDRRPGAGARARPDRRGRHPGRADRGRRRPVLRPARRVARVAGVGEPFRTRSADSARTEPSCR